MHVYAHVYTLTCTRTHTRNTTQANDGTTKKKMKAAEGSPKRRKLSKDAASMSPLRNHLWQYTQNLHLSFERKPNAPFLPKDTNVVYFPRNNIHRLWLMTEHIANSTRQGQPLTPGSDSNFRLPAADRPKPPKPL